MTRNLRIYLLHNCENLITVLQVQFPFRQFLQSLRQKLYR